MSAIQKARKFETLINPQLFQSNSSQNLFILGFSTTIKLYSMKTCEMIKTLELHDSPIINISLDFSGLSLFSCDEDGKLVIYSFSSQKIVKEVHLKFNKVVNGIFDHRNNCFIFKTDKNLDELHFFEIEEEKYYELKANQIKFSQGNKNFNGFQINYEQNLLFDCGTSEINIYNIKKRVFSHKISINNAISCFDVRKDGEYVAIGDNIGRIEVFNGINKNGKGKNITLHWHAQSVLCLKFCSEIELLLSGGREGVLVFWYYQDQKRDFCPRLASPIYSINMNIQEDLLYLIMGDNSLKVLKPQNFLEEDSIKLITIPSSENLESRISSIFVKHPHSSFYVINGLPGEIQFINVKEQKKLGSFKIVSRHNSVKVDDIEPNPVEINHICFDSTGNIMVTSSQRKKKLEEDSTLCSLIFWQENSLYDYRPITRMEYPHGDETHGLISFIQKDQEKDIQRFITFGSDNEFKLWREFTVTKDNSISQPNLKHITKTFWNYDFSGNYKNLKIYQISHMKHHDKDILLISLKNGLAIWSLAEFEVINYLDYNSSTIIYTLPFEEKFIFYSKEKFGLYDMNEQKNIFTSDLDKIMKVISNTNFCYLLVYKETQRISVIVKIDLGKNIIVNTMFYNGFIDEIVFDEENKILFGIDKNFDFICLEGDYEKQLKALETDEMELETAESSNIQTASMSDFLKNYQSHIKKIKMHKNKNLITFNSQSHLIPNLSFIFDEFMDQLFILKENENLIIANEEKMENFFEFPELEEKIYLLKKGASFEEQALDSDYIKKLQKFLN